MKKMILTLALAAGLLVPAVAFVASPAPVYASAFNSTNATKQACSGINGTEGAGDCAAPGTTLTTLIRTVLNLLSAFIGVVAVIMIMLSGFKFVTAAGDAGKVATARSTMIYAIVGLIIVAFAQFITQFIMKKVT
jgi:type IV secretion system pilin